MTMKVSEEAVESVSLKDKRNDIARSQPCLSGIHLMEIMCTCAS